MSHSPRILLLTASYGAGHLLASQAVKEQCIRMGLTHVSIIDLMKEAHPFLNKISTAVYAGSFRAARYGINYYGWSYYLTQKSNPRSFLLSSLNRLGGKQLQKIISEEKPDALVNTFPYGAAPIVGRSLGIPTFTIVTDYFMHARWLHPAVHKYYVASDELKHDMTLRGVDERLVKATGIPIREAFETKPSHGPDKSGKMILLLEGVHSEPVVTGNIIKRLQSMEDLQIVVVCGRNSRLKQILCDQFKHTEQVIIFGFIERIHELMSTATCIISKAGGLTLTELLALQVPVFIYRPYPGQEKDNATYFAQKGVAAISYHINELVSQIKLFLANESQAAQMKCQMDLLYKNKARASEKIVNDMLSSIYQFKDEQAVPYS